jgi:hypothetical protein
MTLSISSSTSSFVMTGPCSASLPQKGLLLQKGFLPRHDLPGAAGRCASFALALALALAITLVVTAPLLTAS